MIKPMDLENIFQALEQFMRGIGLKTKGMGKENKYGLMEPFSKETTKEIRRMGKENSNGLMAVNTLASSKTIENRDRGEWNTLMVENIKAVGWMIWCMEMESSHGRKGTTTRELTQKIRRMGSVKWNIEMVLAMKVIGEEGSLMVKELEQIHMEEGNKEIGMTEWLLAASDSIIYNVHLLIFLSSLNNLAYNLLKNLMKFSSIEQLIEGLENKEIFMHEIKGKRLRK